MISDIEVLYGLANRTKEYGIKKSISDPNKFSLGHICNLKIDGFDGAEDYGWNKDDLNFLKKNYTKKVFTKLNIINLSYSEIKNFFKKHKTTSSSNYITGVYMHNKVTPLSLDKYKDLLLPLRSEYRLKVGISVYTQKDLNLILEKGLETDILQLPLNINCSLDASEFIKKGCEVYARSIFLQGIYFHDNYSMFSSNTIKNIIKQKKILSEMAQINNTNLGQFLFSNAIYNSRKLGYKGIVIGSSNKTRIESYLSNHKKLIKEISLHEFGYDLVDSFLADPRKWKL